MELTHQTDCYLEHFVQQAANRLPLSLCAVIFLAVSLSSTPRHSSDAKPLLCTVALAETQEREQREEIYA